MKHSHIFKTVVAFVLLALTLTLAQGWVGPTANAATEAEKEAIAIKLATLFRSSRAVISVNQKMINDAGKGDKGLSGGKVVELAMQNYKKATNEDLGNIDASSMEGKLMQSMLDAVKEVMTKAQPLINKKGMGFKGFLPAVFAKQVARNFSGKTGGQAYIKLTAPKSYVRNRANRPDEWESQVIESKFKKGWAKGKAYKEVANFKGEKAFRLIIPEYYGSSCLGCHGDPKGARDITGGKKEGGKLGELGGAISVVIK